MAGCAQHFLQDRSAVGIPPLRIVDRDDERRAHRQTKQQIAKRRRSALPHGLRVETFEQRCGHTPHFWHPEQHGKQVSQDSGIAGQDAGNFDVTQRIEVLRKRVDQRIDRLVGHRLAFVAACSERQQRRLAPMFVLEEPAEERGLSHPGRTRDERHDGFSAAGRAGRIAQLGEMGVPTEEHIRGGRRRGHRHARRRAIEPREDLPRRRSLLGFRLEERHRQFRQIARHARLRCERRRQTVLLGFDHIQVSTAEWEMSGEHFVEHDADAVEVGGRCHML